MFELKFKTKSIKTYGKRRHRVVSYLDKSPASSTIPNTPGLCVVKNVIPEKIDPTPKVKRQVDRLKTPILPNKPVYNQVFTGDLKNGEPKATYQGLLHLSQITYTKDKLAPTQPQITTVIHNDGPDSEGPNTTQGSALNTCSLTNSTINSKSTRDTELNAARNQSIDEIKPLRSDDLPSIVNNQEKNTNDDITWFRSHRALRPTHIPIEILSSESEVETSPIPRRVRSPLEPKSKINPSSASTETTSPTRTRSGRQLCQFKANNPDTALERKSFRTVRDPKYVVSSGNHKRILVNSPKPYRSSPFRKRPTLKPFSTCDFEVLVTPMKFKSQVHSDFFQPSKVQSPSKNVPSTFSPRFMSGSPLARSVSRCSISKAAFESQEPIIGVRNGNTKALEDLLHLFGQQDVTTFQSFLGSGLASVRKIGEATFSEVFSCTYPPLSTTVALKVLPFGKGSEVLVNGEVQKTPHDIYQEAFITLILSNLGTLGKDSHTDSLSHFIKVHRVGICQGEYPQEMLDQWDEWAANNPSENERPDFFAHDQLYCVLILEHGGNDLEHVKLQSWDQAKSVLTQVAYSIGFAEKVDSLIC
ncbi:hypothetical protein K7432_009832 [Basidiobolus ranarum]|uniref:Uncharacterized protein n=1 Tax=Basidiobolus ranarum TaxID=34480 RepID=A0ABR2WPL3_9FUNG